MDELKNNVIQNLKMLDKKKALMKGVNQKYGDKRIISKSFQIAEKAKKDGNMLFLKSDHNFKVHHRILCCYNESIAYSPNESEELAIAYGNKSALLRHLRKYNESICEADKALKITKSVSLKVKLLCRKAECYTALGSSENGACLEKARFLLSKYDDTEKMKKMLNNLVLKTQLVVDKGELDTPKEVKRRVQGMKIISAAEKLDVWDSIAIEYSEKYGQHLVAVRDFEPGEIIFVERPYLNIIPDPKAFVYCYHCLKYLWTIVPCDHCAWRAFCSTECKDEAFNEYHGLECLAFMHMKETFSFGQYHQVPFIISIFFKALSEAGGDIHQLQAELESIDKCKDESRRGISPCEKIANYKNIFSLPIRNLEKDELDYCLTNGAVALAGLARFTKIFNTVYDYSQIKQLIKNDTAVFVGALLAKYAIIIVSRCSQIAPFDPEEKPDEIDLGYGIHMRRQNIGVDPINALSVLGQLTILNCIPNLMKRHTHGNKTVAFAVRPIKKGEQLTSTVATLFLGESKSFRQEKYRKLYNRPCDCQACVENWCEPPTSHVFQSVPVSSSELPIATEILDGIRSIRDELERSKCKLNHPDVKLMTRAAKLVEKAWNHFPLPSPMSVKSIHLLMMVSVNFYQAVEEHLEFSETCKKKI